MTSRRARFAMPWLLAWLLPPLAQADYLPSTPAELKAIPAYCAARLEKAGPEAYARWNEIIGPNFIHIHHYCFSLHKRRLAMQESDPVKRQRLLRSAIGEITYVETHAVGDIPFFAEIYTVRGKMHLMLGEKIEAVNYFKRAIARDPRHGPAYGALARMFKDAGRMEQARRVIAEGMRAAPNSPGLRKLQARYGVPPADTATAGTKNTTGTPSAQDTTSGAPDAANTAASP